MRPDNPNLITVFPLTTGAFGLRADWFQTYSMKMAHPAYLLMTLLLVVSVGVMALKRFENAELEKKAWNIPVIMTAVAFWPYVVLGLKDLVDTFNTFIAYDIFGVHWMGFGYPSAATMPSVFGWSAEALARLIPNLAYWIIYAFYIISFFFYAVLGPLILARGILTDEVEGFLDLVKELTLLMLWQTTVVVLVCFIMPDIVSGKPFPPHPQSNFYFLSFILGVMIFFVPALTRKFGSHLGASFVPLGFRYGGAALGLSAIGGFAGAALGSAGLPLREGGFFAAMRERVSKGEEFAARYGHKKHSQNLEYEQEEMQRKLHEDREIEDHAREAAPEHSSAHEPRGDEDLVELAKRAKSEHEDTNPSGDEHS